MHGDFSSLVFLALAIEGIVFICLGRRRKLKDDHPHCQKCGYDLFGQTAPVVICNECGASLTGKGSIIVGFKPGKARMLATGLFMLAIQLLVFGIQAFFWIGRGGLFPYEPTSWVISSAASDSILAQTAAIAELNKRIATKSLTDSQWEKLARIATADRFHPKRRWGANWAPIMQIAFDQHHLAEPTRHQYIAVLTVETESEDIGKKYIAKGELEKLNASAEAVRP